MFRAAMPSNPMPPQIGRYEILEELGKGAMGVVYKAQDPTIGRRVALKTMRLDTHGMEAGELLARFKNEARAAGILNHSNIVTIYDAGEHEGLFYIAMEYIEGTTLQKTLNEEGSVPLELVYDLSRQICAGLDYAHSHKIIHRDVKPANIMIEPDGRVKIMDFGIAKGVGAGLTSAGQVLGTPNYMSPEQVKGRPLDGRSDLWSFGVILYEMVTGEKPFSGQNVTTIIYKIVNEEPIPPRELDSSIHPGLSAVIQRALAKNPDKRYQKGADLVHHLINHKAIGMETGPLAAQASGKQAASMPGAESAAAAAAPARVAPPAPSAAPQPAAMPAKPVVVPPPPAPAPSARPDANETLVAGSHGDHEPVTGRKSAVVTAQDMAQGIASKLTPNQWLTVIAAALVVVIAGFAIGIRRQKAPSPESPPAAVSATPSAPTAQGPAPGSVAPPGATATPAAAEEQPAPAGESPKAGSKSKLRASKTAPTPIDSAAAGATAAAPVNGTLHLVTNPPGAKVDIDGWSDPKWVTPFDSPNLSAGKHKVAFSKPGYAPQTQIVDVWPGKQVIIAATLNEVATPSRLEITSDPAGALIALDGKETGRQTPANLEVTPGDHRITLHKLGYRDAALAANVKVGETGRLSQTLKPQGAAGGANPLGKIFGGGAPEGMGNLQVKTKPKGASVKVNGEEAPKTTPFKVPIDPGTYNVSISLDGYKTLTQTVTVEKGKTASLDLELQR